MVFELEDKIIILEFQRLHVDISDKRGSDYIVLYLTKLKINLKKILKYMF